MCQKHAEYAVRPSSYEYPLLPRITDLRLDRFFGSAYASQHLDKLLDRQRYDSSEYVRMTVWAAPGDSKPSFEEAVIRLSSSQPTLKKGHMFGPSWTNHWIKVDLTIPKELAALDQPIIFEFDPACEAMIYATDGTPLHGITGGMNTMKDGKPGEQEDRRVEHIIPVEAVKAGSYAVVIEVSANLMFGLGVDRYHAPPADRSFPLISADLVVPNLHVRGLRVDFRMLTEVARQPEAKLSGLSQRASKAADDIMNRFIRRFGDEEDNFKKLDEMVLECREIAWSVLGRDREKTCVVSTAPMEAKIWAIGHCHIDTAWLWRYTQTQQKIARSWTTQCDLMDRWPNHQFAASSAQQYLWLEQLYPKGFDRVKHYVEEKRFHPVGGAWLEHDCMMPSGESLVRQYLYGQRYFKSRFGAYCREAWLPDTFGYASQLPQILRQAGLKYFFTQKLGWNNINVFPHSTFNWAGIDGTQVLAHMTPVDQYNGQCKLTEIVKGIRDNKNLEVTDDCLFLFGNGDGGGGPTPLMMEKLERLSSLSSVAPSIPAIKMGSPVEFFDNLLASTDNGKRLPTWKGELYLELHRGTYTTQTKIKAGNRDMETLLRDVEYFATMASILDPDYQYPHEEIDESWQDVLLGQFHDCLPGTTINSVVLDNLNIYAKRTTQAQALLQTAFKSLVTKGSPTVVDPLRLQRDEVVVVDGRLAWLHTESNGIGSLTKPPQGTTSARQDGDRWILSNTRYTLVISHGRVSSIIDNEQERELIAPGPGSDDAGLMIYEDIPLTYDAWDAEVYHLKCGSAIPFDSVEAVNTPLRSSLVAKAKFGRSTAVVTISLDVAGPLIRVNTKLDWQEKHKFLKFALPLDITSPNATYGTQFGLIERPTHRNTSIDQAKFEVCAHGFADLSEAGYGVAIACRDKYGYAVEFNCMRLSLVRAPASPDPETDIGAHDIDFAIIPHVDRLGHEVVNEVQKFINKPYYLDGEIKLPSFKITGVQSAGINLETIKRGNDGSVILRMHEALGGRARGKLEMKFKKAEWVDILEDFVEPAVTNGDSVELNLKCFELRTLKVYL